MRIRAKSLFAAALAVAAPTASQAGWPFTADGPRRGTEAYYGARACDPVGERQVCKHGKLWPPFARPVGEEQTCVHKYHALHYWPYPYNVQDRQDVRMVMQTQVANGWTTATTLYDYHFDPVTHQLNSAGQQHLSWILTQTPPAYRFVHIESAVEPSISDARMMSVQKTLASMAGADGAPPITLRATDPLGRPATEVETIFKSAAENAPPPTIQYQAVGSASGN